MMVHTAMWSVRIYAHGASLVFYFDQSPNQDEIRAAVRMLLHPSLHSEVLQKIDGRRYAIEQETLTKIS